MRLSTAARKAVAKSPGLVYSGALSLAASKALARIVSGREPLRRLLATSCCWISAGVASLMRFLGMTVQCFEHSVESLKRQYYYWWIMTLIQMVGPEEPKNVLQCGAHKNTTRPAELKKRKSDDSDQIFNFG